MNPIVLRSVERLDETSWATMPVRSRWKKTAPTMITTWVATKVRKIGTSALTDSFTPRRFITVKSAITVNATGCFIQCIDCGKFEKTASAPDATEVVMV